MLISDLQNKKILIWGMGSEGRAVKEYLERHKVSSKIRTYNDDEGAEVFSKLLKMSVQNSINTMTK